MENITFTDSHNFVGVITKCYLTCPLFKNYLLRNKIRDYEHGNWNLPNGFKTNTVKLILFTNTQHIVLMGNIILNLTLKFTFIHNLNVTTNQ